MKKTLTLLTLIVVTTIWACNKEEIAAPKAPPSLDALEDTLCSGETALWELFYLNEMAISRLNKQSAPPRKVVPMKATDPMHQK